MAEEDTLGLSFEESGRMMDLHFNYIPTSDYLPLLEQNKPRYCKGTLFDDRLLYLSAYRIAPRELYQIADEKELEKRELGINGELALHYLYAYGDQSITNEKVLYDVSSDRSLQIQLRYWLSLISPGIIPLIDVDSTLRKAELRYAFREGDDRTNAYKSLNVGFGITYVLPVVTSLLLARPGDLLLIENPEAHIHPSGQKWIGNLIASAASGGVQVIVETHSDHVINGIRLAVKHGKINHEDAGIFFFYKDEEDGYRHKVSSPRIDENGKIDIWPSGFLDEWDAELLELL